MGLRIGTEGNGVRWTFSGVPTPTDASVGVSVAMVRESTERSRRGVSASTAPCSATPRRPTAAVQGRSVERRPPSEPLSPGGERSRGPPTRRYSVVGWAARFREHSRARCACAMLATLFPQCTSHARTRAALVVRGRCRKFRSADPVEESRNRQTGCKRAYGKLRHVFDPTVLAPETGDIFDEEAVLRCLPLSR